MKSVTTVLLWVLVSMLVTIILEVMGIFRMVLAVSIALAIYDLVLKNFLDLEEK